MLGSPSALPFAVAFTGRVRKSTNKLSYIANEKVGDCYFFNAISQKVQLLLKVENLIFSMRLYKLSKVKKT